MSIILSLYSPNALKNPLLFPFFSFLSPLKHSITLLANRKLEKTIAILQKNLDSKNSTGKFFNILLFLLPCRSFYFKFINGIKNIFSVFPKLLPVTKLLLSYTNLLNYFQTESFIKTLLMMVIAFFISGILLFGFYLHHSRINH